MLFYPWIDEFKWDPENHGTNATIIDNKKIQSKRRGWAICVSPNIISSDICDWYEWELELNAWNI